MKAYCWLLVFLGSGVIMLGACAPEQTADLPTILRAKPTSTYAYTYLCEIGDPDHINDCDDPGSSGYDGEPYGPCPVAMTQAQCWAYQDAITAMMHSSDPSCITADT